MFVWFGKSVGPLAAGSAFFSKCISWLYGALFSMKSCLVQPRYRGEGHCHTSKGYDRLCPLSIENFTISGEWLGVCEERWGKQEEQKELELGLATKMRKYYFKINKNMIKESQSMIIWSLLWLSISAYYEESSLHNTASGNIIDKIIYTAFWNIQRKYL